MNNSNNISAEAAFEKAKRIFFNAMLDRFLEKYKGDYVSAEAACEAWVNNLKLSQNEIRLECLLNATATNFQFAITTNDQNSGNTLFNTENRLRQQDSLVASEYGIYVGNPSSNTAVDWELRTYGNLVDFTAAQAAALDKTFYSNGYFRVSANNDTVVPYRGVWNHLYRPQTQQTAALGPASPGDQIRGSEDGMITLQPNLLLIGTKGYIPEIKIPAALASVATFTRAVLIFRGVLAQNSTSFS